MATLPAQCFYRAKAGTDAAPANCSRVKYPLPKECPIQFDAPAYDQDFEMLLSSFPPAPKNTLANDTAFGLTPDNAILTGYTQPAPTGCGQGRFSAEFTVVPEPWDDFKTMPWTAPGFIGIIGDATSRAIDTYKVTTRLRYDYFLVDPDGVATGLTDSGGGDVTIVLSMGAIPVIQKNYFVNTSAGSPVFNSHVDSLVPAAGITIGEETYVPTFPTVETYIDWIGVVATFLTDVAAGTTQWDQTHPPVWDITTPADTYGQLVADDSWLEPYAGNIIARITPYVLVR